MTGRSRRLVVLSLFLVAAISAALPGFVRGTAVAKAEFGLPAAQLYAVSGDGSATVAPIDPATLQSRADQPLISLDLGWQGYQPILSADGSTLVVATSETRLSVRDGMMGPERVEIAAGGMIGDYAIGRDGRRVIVFLIEDYSGKGLRLPVWKVFDAFDGHLIATVENKDRGDQWALWTADGDLARLYRMALADRSAISPENARPTQIIAHDLTTGAEIGRVELPGVLGGFWQGPETVSIGAETGPLMHELAPGLAVSPDGKVLAIAHAEVDAVTLIDTERLAVDRTLELTRPQSFVHRLAGFFSLAPRSAAAKALEGANRQAVFSPDGTRLFVSGNSSHVEDGSTVWAGSGVQAVDVATGTLNAAPLEDGPIDRVFLSPDGGSLYVAGADSDSALSDDTWTTRYRLQRLDARSLEREAQASFPSYQTFLIRSAIATAELPLTVELVDMAFLPNIVTIPADVEIELTLVNHGSVTHSLRAGDEVGKTWDVHATLAPGERTTVTIKAPAGEYKLICDEEGHATAGMGGAIVAR